MQRSILRLKEICYFWRPKQIRESNLRNEKCENIKLGKRLTLRNYHLFLAVLECMYFWQNHFLHQPDLGRMKLVKGAAK
jgi:hypothetical protein